MALSLELSTLANFENALDALSPLARYRILLYLNLKYEIDTEKQEARVKGDGIANGVKTGMPLAPVVAMPPAKRTEKPIPVKDALKIPGVKRATLYTAIRTKRIPSEIVDAIAHVYPADVRALFQKRKSA